MPLKIFHTTSGQKFVHVFLICRPSNFIKPLSDVVTIMGAPVSAGIVTGSAKRISPTVMSSFIGGVSDNIFAFSGKRSAA